MTRYQLEQFVVIVNGVPHLEFEWVLNFTEPVQCQDDVVDFTEFHDDLFFKIKCNFHGVSIF